MYLLCRVFVVSCIFSRTWSVVACRVELKAALSLLNFGCDCGDCLFDVVVVVVVVVVVGCDVCEMCEMCEMCEVCELVLVFRDLVYHSLDFEDVPLVAVADMSFGKVEVCSGHRVHCEFVRLLLKGATVFELADDAIARCNA